jgi:MFS superfamily sulfate permease-like transporter
MNAKISSFRPRAATMAGLVVGALGIAILWALGVEFPFYPPPGIIVLVVGTVFVALGRWSWTRRWERSSACSSPSAFSSARRD